MDPIFNAAFMQVVEEKSKYIFGQGSGIKSASRISRNEIQEHLKARQKEVEDERRKRESVWKLKINLKRNEEIEKISSVAETVAIFKLLPFHVLFASLAPSGCEGSLMSFLASALYFSSIFNGVLDITLSTFLGITRGNYSSLHNGILIQFVAALLPLGSLIMYLWLNLQLKREGREVKVKGRENIGG
ncbi:hypothetical protein FXO38_25609 [Capsicum annuum]|nr:hypothetical protein FXO38_25609 [Capsicum annuum]